MESESLIAISDSEYKAENEHAESARGNASTVANLYVGTTERLFDLNRMAIRTSIDEQRAVSLKAAEEPSLLGAWRLQASYARGQMLQGEELQFVHLGFSCQRVQ